MENITATTTEVLYFPGLLFSFPDEIDNVSHIIVRDIPRCYLEHSFRTRRSAINFFLTHNTSVFVPLAWRSYLTYSAKCFHRSTKKMTTFLTCNFCPKDVETLSTHLPHHYIEQYMLGRTLEKVSTIPNAQDDSKRHHLRQDLFGGRLAKLCKIARVPVFNKTTHLTERMYIFNDRKFTIIYSRDDSFTEEYIRKMRQIELRAQALCDITLINDANAKRITDALFSIHTSITASIARTIFETISSMVGVIANLAILLANPTPFIAVCAITSIFAQLAPAVAAQISEFLHKEVRPQSSMTWIPSAVSLLLIIILGSNNLTASKGISICQRVTKLGFTLGSIGVFHRIFGEAWKELYPFIHERLYGTAPGFEECLSQLEDFKTLVARVDRFQDEERYKHITNSRPVCDEVYALHRDLLKLFATADRMKLRPLLNPVIRIYQQRIQEWHTKAMSSAYKVSGTRIEPVVVHIYGPSGIGKSRVTPCLILEVLKDELDFETFPELSSHIYTRNAASEFWAGYSGQMAVVFDDFMQKRDSESSPNPEVFEVIQSANNAPFLVPMADLSEKANSYFTSKFMVLTSNVETLSPKSITHPAALQRRMDIVLEMTRPREPVFSDEKFDTSCYDFTLQIDKRKGPVVNFEQLVTILREKRQLKNNSADSMLKDVHNRKASEPIKEDLSNIPNIDRIIGQPADMTQAKVPLRARPQGLMDWMGTTPSPFDKTRHADAISNIAPIVLGQPIKFRDIRALKLQKYFHDEDSEMMALETVIRYCKTQEDVTQVLDTPLCPADDIDIAAYLLELKGTSYETAINEAAKNHASTSSLNALWETTVLGHLKRMYKASPLVKIVESSWQLKLTGAAIMTAVLTGLYLMIKYIKPSTPIRLTPDQYSDLWTTAGSDEPTPDTYAELYEKDLSVCDDLSRSIRESWDHMGRTPGMKGPVKGARTESWDHMGRTPGMKGPVKGARAVRNGDADPASSSIVSKLQDQVAIFYARADSLRQSGIGTFFIGRCCFLNLHVLDALAVSDKCHVQLPCIPQRIAFEWADLKLHRHPEIDLAMIEFPSQVRDHKNMLKHVCVSDDLAFRNTTVRIPLKRARNFEILTIKATTSDETLIVGTDSAVPEEEDECFQVKGYIEYSGGCTIEGDCGSVVVLADPRVSRKICGLHVAGTTNSGFAFILVRDHLDYLLDQAKPESKLEFVPPVAEPMERPQMQGAFEHLGCIPNPPFEPTRTSIRTSEIAGLFPLTKVPAILRPTSGVDPLVKGAQAFGSDPGYISEADQASCRDTLEAAFFPGEPTISRTLTIEEAVFGIPGIIEPLKTDTSPGFPWCTQGHPEPGKRHWIQLPNFIHQDLRNAVNELIQDAKDGKISPTIFKDTLKDERRKLSRCDPKDPDNIKTRVFAASPMHLVIFLKMYYGAYFTHMQNQRIKNTTAIGVNPYSVEWHQIVLKLREVSPKANDGDYERFDTTQPPALIDNNFIVARKWYRMYDGTKEDDQIRMCAGRQVTFAIHMCRGELSRVAGKNPSGTYGTTQINSGTNIQAFQYAWDKINPHLRGATEFHKNVRLVTNGDDVIFSVHPRIKNFTITNIGAAMNQINMNITPALKEGGFVEERPVEECTFLKRGFIRMAGFYRGPLDIETCKDMTQWTKKSRDNLAATIENCKIAASELAITQPSGEVREQLGFALAKIGSFVHLPTTAEVLEDHKQFF